MTAVYCDMLKQFVDDVTIVGAKAREGESCRIINRIPARFV